MTAEIPLTLEELARVAEAAVEAYKKSRFRYAEFSETPEWRKAWREANLEARKQSDADAKKKYRAAEENKAKEKRYRSEWLDKNPEKQAEYSKRKRQSFTEEQRARERERERRRYVKGLD